MKVFCVIPAWNEEKSIAKVIRDVKPYVDEVVVVDDCSADSTYSILESQDVNVLRHVVNRGQGAALQTGNNFALENGADIVVHFDADGQFLASEINDLLNPIKNDACDVVFGSRFLTKKSKMPFLKKNVLMPIGRIVNKIFFNINLTDPQSGFRAMNRRALESVRIEQREMAHCSEIIAKSFSSKLRIQEVPITVIYENFGQGIGGGIRIIKDIIISKLIK